MGCDACLAIEYRYPSSEWKSIGGVIDAPRNYEMFGLISGVRGGEALFEPRGLPVGELSREVSDACFEPDSYYNIRMSGVVPERRATGDYHSASWMSLDEYESVYAEANRTMDFVPVEYIVYLDMMRSMHRNGMNTRILFWFDS